MDAVATEEQACRVRLINAATAATAATATTDLDVERAREKSDGSFGAEEILEILNDLIFSENVTLLQNDVSCGRLPLTDTSNSGYKQPDSTSEGCASKNGTWLGIPTSKSGSNSPSEA